MYTILLIKNDGSKTYDITPIVTSISYESSMSMYCPCEININYHDMPRLMPKNPCDLGDVILLTQDNVEVHRWILVNESQSGRDTIKYTCYDFAWYLGKSTSVYQFNSISASQAIEKVLTDFGMMIGHIPTMSTIIDDIYIKQSPAYIIDDIWKKHEQFSGKRYVIEMRKGKIYIEEQKDMLIKGSFKLADNLQANDIMDFPINASRTRSIEEMRNRIKILLESENDVYEVVALSENEELISKYGLLEDTFTVDAEDIAKAREVAKILLQRLGKVHESNTITLMGDPKFKGGYLVDITENITGMNGRYVIKSAKHTISNQLHTMDIELVLPEEVK